MAFMKTICFRACAAGLNGLADNAHLRCVGAISLRDGRMHSSGQLTFSSAARASSASNLSLTISHHTSDEVHRAYLLHALFPVASF